MLFCDLQKSLPCIILRVSEEISEMTTDTHQYAGRNCTKGIPCGNTCISAGKKCKNKLPAKTSASLDALTNPDNLESGAGSSGGLTDKFPPLNTSELETVEQIAEIGSNTVTTVIFEGYSQPTTPPPFVQEIGILINSQFDKNSSIEGKDGLKLALASREHVRDYIKNAPEGTVLSNSPYQDDGFGDQRARLYEKAGFSAPNENNEMYSIVSGGKNIPITLDEIKALKDAGHFTK